MKQPGLDFYRLCIVLASHWMTDIKTESVFVVCSSGFAFKNIYPQLEVGCIFASVIFDNELLRLVAQRYDLVTSI